MKESIGDLAVEKKEKEKSKKLPIVSVLKK